MVKLQEILTLDRIDDFIFQGRSRPGLMTRIFGGEVVGQAMMAAGRTVTPERPVHSLHASFLLPGDPAHPVTYTVDPLRDGGSFSTRAVEAVQRGRVIFQMTASFHRPEPGFSHQVPRNDAPAPDDVPPMEETLRDSPQNLEWATGLAVRIPVEMRFPEPPLRVFTLAGGAAPPRQRVWLRSPDPLPPDPVMQAAGLTYYSDLLLLSAALGPHGALMQGHGMQVATLSHSVHFHAPARVDDWFLYDQEGFWSGYARALCRGSVFDRDGTLVATTLQEGLVRRTDP